MAYSDMYDNVCEYFAGGSEIGTASLRGGHAPGAQPTYLMRNDKPAPSVALMSSML